MNQNNVKYTLILTVRMDAAVELNPNLIMMLLQDARNKAEGDGSTKLRLTKTALSATTELCRLFIVSARARADAEAHSEGNDSISPENVEAVMAELMADF